MTRLSKQFQNDVITGLACEPRRIPCKYFYDAHGSELFERICQTDDYYVTRADLALHETHLGEICALIGPQAHIIEFGSGAGVKTRKLLAGLNQPRAYTPIEISASALNAATRELKEAFPEIDIHPLRADYTEQLSMEALQLEPPARRRVVYFPGSTIGNFSRDEAVFFLARMARLIDGFEGGLLIGVDLLKKRDILVRAYDDREGITAAFNRNLLLRMKRELDAELELEAFDHEARFNNDENRVEMHLVANRPTVIRLAGQAFSFNAGQSIHTENCHKYSVHDFRRLADAAGLVSQKVWKDPDGLFSMHWLERKPSA